MKIKGLRTYKKISIKEITITLKFESKEIGYLNATIYTNCIYLNFIYIHKNYRNKNFGHILIERFVSIYNKKFNDLKLEGIIFNKLLYEGLCNIFKLNRLQYRGFTDEEYKKWVNKIDNSKMNKFDN